VKRFGLFRGGGVDYAVPLQRLVRILPGERCYLLPKLPQAVAGVIVADGQLIPQLDLAKVLPCSEYLNVQAAYQVLVESECGTLALPAIQTCGIIAGRNGEVTALAEDSAVRGLSGEFHFQERIFQILDIDCLAIGLIQESW
jgi:chemotaxis signal transduction protein